MTIGVTISLNPIWQCLATVDFFSSLALIASRAEWLKIPNKAGSTFADRMDMIDGKLVEGKFLIAHQAMEVVKPTQVIPFIGCVSASGLGLACSSNNCIFAIFFFPLGD